MGRAKVTKKKEAFLAAFAQVGNITLAAEIAGIHRRMHYTWLANDPDYAVAFKEAEEEAADRLEHEARRRAVEGTLKPVFYQGEECGHIREYSDTLLIFLLKGARPEKYKERVSAEHTGKDGGPIVVKNYDNLSDEELDQLILEKAAALEKAGAVKAN
jgi:hypothetical protein